VLILLTNDDGIYAPGLAAMERQLRELGDVCLVAPATEQSGVGHSITYLTPITTKEVYVGPRHWGWAVEGSPADCVKIGVSELCPRTPDLVVSGINGGLNAGINVLYSGTVAAAIEGAFFGITSVAVSLQFNEHADFDKAARLATTIIRQILDQKGPQTELYNLNIPIVALEGGEAAPEVRTVPMDVTPYDEQYEKRIDPFGRPYYWATGSPPPGKKGAGTDLSAIAQGFVSLTPLDYNMTKRAELEKMDPWQFRLDDSVLADVPREEADRQIPVIKTTKKRQKNEDDLPGAVQ
jgi:5'-nucleotidase